ncbi:hypothetical protein HG535_0G02410 [Zygotorulaspora mrakii]|uniref:Uncharacterized protein n=1 Tax=Zygotorulaspora mrakii TaxID=42260 RepID=A0A7H9B710_ZYGMR|nr:uncharacterized protein HG535_0G02410 [Zygotorulaspora mrakii]QLG74357.1 hypothetical protein HG535_0G02410 [Zygotorulaspora mrakii]
MGDHITFRIKGGLFLITLNDPLKLNSLSFEDFNYIASLLEQSERCAKCCFTVIQSTGTHFSAGGKIEAVTAGSQLGTGELIEEICAPNVYVANTFATHSKPLICCLNGPAVGLAASMVLLCDIVFAVNSSVYLSFPFSALGFVPELSSSVTLPWKLGQNASYEHLIFSTPIYFRELYESGILSKNFDIDSSEKDASKRFNEECNRVLKPFCGTPATLQDIKTILSSSQLQHHSWLIKAQADEVATTLPFWVNGEPFKRFRKLLSRKRSKL